MTAYRYDKMGRKVYDDGTVEESRSRSFRERFLHDQEERRKRAAERYPTGTSTNTGAAEVVPNRAAPARTADATPVGLEYLNDPGKLNRDAENFARTVFNGKRPEEYGFQTLAPGETYDPGNDIVMDIDGKPGIARRKQTEDWKQYASTRDRWKKAQLDKAMAEREAQIQGTTVEKMEAERLAQKKAQESERRRQQKLQEGFAREDYDTGAKEAVGDPAKLAELRQNLIARLGGIYSAQGGQPADPAATIGMDLLPQQNRMIPASQDPIVVEMLQKRYSPNEIARFR